jgi:hypothetical protein
MAPLTTFTIDDAGNLRIALTDSGREAWDEVRAERDAHGIDWAFLTLIDHQLCNGWEAVRAEAIGALTNSFLLSDEARLGRWPGVPTAVP